MIKEFLLRAHNEKTLVGVTTQLIAWDESIIGYIIDMDDNYFTINEMDEYGALIGNTTIAIQDVLHIEPESWYMRNLLFIHSKASTFASNSRVTLWKKGGELNVHFEYIKENRILTRFFFEDDNFVIGMIKDLNTEHVMIENIGQDGSWEGVTIYKINDLIGLRYNGLEEQKIQLLFKKR